VKWRQVYVVVVDVEKSRAQAYASMPSIYSVQVILEIYTHNTAVQPICQQEEGLSRRVPPSRSNGTRICDSTV